MDSVKFFNSITVKVIFIGILVLGLLIPITMISSIIHEREMRQKEAVDEVTQKWGRRQVITGPILTIPYKVVQMEKIKNRWGKVVEVKEHLKRIEYAHFLPEKTVYNGRMDPQIRSRGTFDIILYTSYITVEGNFSPDFSSFDPDEEKVVIWKDAVVDVGIENLQGIEKPPFFSLNDTQYSLEPTPATSLIASGVRTKLLDLNENKKTYPFKLELDLRGSERIAFVPLGKVTEGNLFSSWQNPSFDGQFLPKEHTINEEGFSAKWNVSHFGRSFPHKWKAMSSDDRDIAYKMETNAFGVTLLMPVDVYQKNERSIKYAILFIVLIFTAFFLFEVLNRMRIHPIQYSFIGLAMCVFYILLLSLSEHITFLNAYIAASVATTLIITLYSRSVLKQKMLAFVIAILLILIYAYLYIVLQSQDYSLLLGSVILFVVLGTVMFLTRNIDWYSIKVNRDV